MRRCQGNFVHYVNIYTSIAALLDINIGKIMADDFLYFIDMGAILGLT